MQDERFRLDEAIAVLERTPATLNELLSGLPEKWVAATEGAGTWSPYDVVGHLIQGEKTNWMVRARHMLAAAPGPFGAFDRTAHFSASRGKSLRDLLATFAELRRDNIAALTSLDLNSADLARTGQHPALGATSLAQLLAAWVVHDLDHVAQVARTMAKAYRTQVGPWRAYLSILSDRE
jgi:hypothetical protein